MICCGLDLAFWSIAKQYLEPSIKLSRGAFDAEDIYNLIIDKKAQLWGVHDGDLKAVIVTEIIIYPKVKRLRLFLLGGHEMCNWEDMVSDTFDRFAKENGCDGIELLGRQGWVKNLKQYGYEQFDTAMLKKFKE